MGVGSIFQLFSGGSVPWLSSPSQSVLASPDRTALHKPRGVIHPRVQAVGPEHFAFLCVDCAKARSKIMLADFYGRVLLEPTTVEHDQPGFEAALQQVRDAMDRHGIKDMIVVVERTGRYHGPIQRAFAKAGFEVRILHPYTTKQYRQPADPGNKTDDTDLSAIHRAAVNGFGLLEHEPDPIYVQTPTAGAAPPRPRAKEGRAPTADARTSSLVHARIFTCFADIFDSEILLWVAKNLGSAAAIVQAGIDGLTQQLRKRHVQTHKPTLQKIVAWARSAPSAEEPASLHRRFFIELDADRLAKLQSIRAIESELAEPLSQTPYVLLLGIPGINVVSAAEFAGEMGPIEHYRQGPSDYRASRVVPVAVPERRGRSPRRPVGAARQPRPAARDPHDCRQPDQDATSTSGSWPRDGGSRRWTPATSASGSPAGSAGSPTRWWPAG